MFYYEPQGEGFQRCNIWGVRCKELPSTGYSNLVSHPSSRHEAFRAQHATHNHGTERLFQLLGSYLKKFTIATSGSGGWSYKACRLAR
ncbi:hypothetical protein GN958_ATG01666 [Phytophthora infestans]|uniref:Uncharacterized protein n=1 Tax=Phytophthora infestans TaxID=4787 RepID=A0A8S9V7T5_PHYIN|nr:hypothetical protein GN958_ATG01666 [Phytophthora infestans]